MPNQSNHKDLVYYSTSNSVFSALIMFKCVGNSETLAYSTLSACGQRVDFITESEQKRGRKNNFFTIISTDTLYYPFSIIWIASSCTRDTTPLPTCLESESKRLELPATEVRRLSVSFGPPHAPNLGRQASLPIVLVVFETLERVWCYSLRLLLPPTNMPIRLGDSSQATSQYSKIAGLVAKDRNLEMP